MLTELAQTFIQVFVNGEIVERAPWDPVALAAELRTHSIDEFTLCSGCGVSSGLLHWPFCKNDWLPDGEPIITSGVTIEDFHPRSGANLFGARSGVA
jgi:hypothetical protein